MHKSHGEASGHSMSKLKSIKPLLNPKMFISTQNCHCYTRNSNSEMSGDSQKAFLHCEDVSDVGKFTNQMQMHGLREGPCLT